MDPLIHGGVIDVLTGEMTVTKVFWTKNTSTMNNGESYPGWTSAGIRGIISEGGAIIGTISNISGSVTASKQYFVANIAGSNDPGTTGGHKDTAGRRMISNYGVEDCCGVLWQWTKDCFEAMSVSWNSANTWMEGYSWQTKSVVSTIDLSTFFLNATDLFKIKVPVGCSFLIIISLIKSPYGSLS